MIISLTENNSGSAQKLLFEVNTTIGLQNTTAALDSTGTLFELKRTPARYHNCAVYFLQLGSFWIAFRERFVGQNSSINSSCTVTVLT